MSEPSQPTNRTTTVLGHLGLLSQPLQDLAPLTSEPIIALGYPRSYSQLCQEPASPSSMQTPPQDHPRPQISPPAGQHQHQDPQGCAAREPRTWLCLPQADTSSETPWTPQPAILGCSPTHQWAESILGHSRTFSEMHHEQALPTSRPTLDPRPPAPQTLDPRSTHQCASTSPWTPQGTTPNCLMTQPCSPAASSFCTKQVWQPSDRGRGGGGNSHAYQTIHSIQPTTVEGPTQST